MENDSLIGKHLCMIGYSGHAFVIIEALRSNHILVDAYCDSHEKSSNPYGLTYFGSETDDPVITKLKEKDYIFFIGIGNNDIRQRVYQNIQSKNLSSIIVRDISAIVSSSAIIGEATFIASGAIVQAQTVIGRGVICNSGSVIEHECQVGDFAHIGPGAILCGNVNIGMGSLIGAGAVVNPGIKIGSNAIIGSGAVVISNVADNTVVVGNPSRKIKVRL